ncbi:MAG: hypothetical protein Q4D85_04095 [Corynebacterium sp.]|uniref:hypothetical protein n=1 Tax=Corynebacterium sp. TaxID=1720 RepID=UPI0026DCCB64|nr:hypothetical protein [Corynebacterium sp.]MDO5097917.1 hypothetical protein [Corynebacterium sp.]
MSTQYQIREPRRRDSRNTRRAHNRDASSYARGRSSKSYRPSAYTSRDLSTSGATTMVLTESAPVVEQRNFGGAPTRVPHRPRPTAAPKRKFQRSAGSQQVFTERGKRLVRPKADPKKVRFAASTSLILVFGVVMAMVLSGLSTEQTFQIQQLRHQEATLHNQLETLNRDLQNVSATAEIARQAQEMGLVVPDQPGILIRNENGDMVEQRPPSDVTRPIVDVNGQQVRPRVASSDPVATQEVSGNLNEVQPVQPSLPNVAPYLASVPSGN